MDPHTEAPAMAVADDLSALSWVHDELRRSLETAHKALRRFLKEVDAQGKSDINALDSTALRQARAQIHLGVGALELVNLPEAATLLRASEALLQRQVSKPGKFDIKVIDAVERASFALLDYVSRRLAGKGVSPLSMFPQYQTLLEFVGSERVHPADLWDFEWSWRDIPTIASASPLEPNEQTLSSFEAMLMGVVRGGAGQTQAACGRLTDVCAGLASGASDSAARSFWTLAAGMFEALSRQWLVLDVYGKRAATSLLSALRKSLTGRFEASDRLARDLLFFCAQSKVPDGEHAAPYLDAVRQAYGLEAHPPADYMHSALGAFDPAWIGQARKRVSAAKESWSSVAAGELDRQSVLAEQFSLVGESLKRLFPHGSNLADELNKVVSRAGQASAPPPATLAMEVATGLLYIDAVLEDADFDDPKQAERVDRLSQRVARVSSGMAPEPLEPWMEQLYRRVSDRQTLGSVVQELRSSLAEAEKRIDQYFRNPEDHASLVPVPGQLAAMRGVLSVLGIDQASAALQSMRGLVDQLASDETATQALQTQSVLDRLATNLGALGFLIDMLSVQPVLAKALFRFDASTGTLSPVMGRGAIKPETATITPLRPEPRSVEGPASDRAPLTDALYSAPMPLKLAAVTADAPPEYDDEMREVFIEEALDVISDARVALDQLLKQPSDMALQTTVRRAFHTLKGSSRMVGLPEFGEAAWACERLYNTQLADHRPAEGPLIEFTDWALTELGGWIAEIAGQSETQRSAAAITESAARIAKGLPMADALPPSDIELPLASLSLSVASAPAPLMDLVSIPSVTASGSLDVEALAKIYAAAAKPPLPATPSPAPTLESWDHPPADQVSDRPLDFLNSGFGIPLGEGLDGHAPTLAPSAGPNPHPTSESALPELSESLDWPLDFTTNMDGPESVPVAPREPEAEPTASSVSPEPLAEQGREESPKPSASIEWALDEQAAAFQAPFLAQADQPVPSGTASWVPESTESAFSISEFNALVGESGMSAASNSRPNPEGRSVVADEASAEADWPAWADLAAAELEETKVMPSSPDIAELEQDAKVVTAAQEELLGEQAVAHGVESSQTGALSSGAEVSNSDEENVKVIGTLRIGIPLFNIYLNEADELSRRLSVEVAEWALELHRPVSDTAVALAHSLAGNSATVGFSELSRLGRALEHAMDRSHAAGRGTLEEAELFAEVAEDVRRLLHQFAAGFLQQPAEGLLERLARAEALATQRFVDASSVEELASDAPSPSVHGSLEAQPVAAYAPLPDPEQLAAVQGHGVDAMADPVQVGSTLPEPSAREPLLPHSGASGFAALGQSVPVQTLLPNTSGGSGPNAGLTSVDRIAAPAQPLTYGEVADVVDAELFPIFQEEAEELLPQLAEHLRGWSMEPGVADHGRGAMRTLHTLKGGARLAGAMHLGEQSHRLEADIERLLASAPTFSELEDLQARGDTLLRLFEALKARDAQAYAQSARWGMDSKPVPLFTPEVLETPSKTLGLTLNLQKSRAAQAEPAEDDWPLPSAVEERARAAEQAALLNGATPEAANQTPAEHGSDTTAGEGLPLPEHVSPSQAATTWPSTEITALAQPEVRATTPDDAPRAVAAPTPPFSRRSNAEQAGSRAAVRVRAPLLDRLVNQAGEVSITRSRIQSEVGHIRGSLGDLADNIERLRLQMRDIELQAETQMSSRLEAAKAASQNFDPLEFDRFTRFQELTRMMAESVNDVATVQRTLQGAINSAEDELAAQGRLTRDLQDDLLRTRMVEFDALSDRLYRVVRQAAKETGKQVRLDIEGGAIEVDRGVLDRMVAGFEHLLRNSVAHGIEAPSVRIASGKSAIGTVQVAVSQEGNEVGVEVRDDGAGLDLERIRAKAVGMGLLGADQSISDADLANVIFTPGFSTADSVTELAGRGVGMDVVRSEINAIGGRIETHSVAGKGTTFKLVLPLTTAVTQVVMLRCDSAVVAVPSVLIETVLRASGEDVERAYDQDAYQHGSRSLPFFWLGALLQISPRSVDAMERTRAVVIVRSAQQRIAIHVDEVLGNQEAVVKNLGPQLSRLPGLAGMTLLASGAVALIYNPVALASLYGDSARQATHAARQQPVVIPTIESQARAAVALAPLVLVVDDSLTVRRVTQRLLVREGYRVSLAKDGLDAIERLAEERPAIVLSDIEMPRMDGFDFVRNMRADARFRELPVIMITSRIAQKHRDYASELGVEHYLGKPYSEEVLLALVGRYTQSSVPAATALALTTA